MYFIYADESSDPGHYNGDNTPHFILSGLLVPDEEWAAGQTRMLAFREGVKQATGLPQKVGFHSSELVRPHKPDVYKQSHESVRGRRLKSFMEVDAHLFSQGAHPDWTPRHTTADC